MSITIPGLADKLVPEVTDRLEISENPGSFNITIGSLGNIYQAISEKGAANGYAGLDGSSELLLTNFPTGDALQILRRNAANNGLEFTDATNIGDVVGPGSSTTNGITKYADTTGNLLADSTILIDANNELIIPHSIQFTDDDSLPSGAITYIQKHSNMLRINVESSDDLEITYNGVLKYDLTINRFNFHAKYIEDLESIRDVSSQRQLAFDSVGSAINYFQITNAITGTGPTLKVLSEGADTNVDFNIDTLGNGTINLLSDVTMGLNKIEFNNPSEFINQTTIGRINLNASSEVDVKLAGGLSYQLSTTRMNLFAKYIEDVESIRNRFSERQLGFGTTTGSVNYLELDSAIAGNGPVLETMTEGIDTDVDFNIDTLGLGTLNLLPQVNVSENITFLNSTITPPSNTTYIRETDAEFTFNKKVVGTSQYEFMLNGTEALLISSDGFFDFFENYIRKLESIRDAGDERILQFIGVASAANYLRLTNSISGNGPILETITTSGDPDVDFNIGTVGDGTINLLSQVVASNSIVLADIPGSFPADTVNYISNSNFTMKFNLSSDTKNFLFTANGMDYVEFTETFINLFDKDIILGEGHINFKQIATPIAPSINQGILYVKEVDFVAHLFYQNFDVEIDLSASSPIGKHDIYIDAGGIVPISPASTSSRLVGAGDNQKSLVFVRYLTGVDSFAVVKFKLPRNYSNGTIQVLINWTTDVASAGNVLWDVAGAAVGNGDDISSINYGAEAVTVDSEIGADVSHDTARIGPITLANTPAEDDTIYLRIRRSGTNILDTFPQTAELLGISIEMEIDEGTAA